MRTRLLVLLVVACALGVLAAPASAFDAQTEAKNFAKIGEREHYLTGTPEFQLLLQKQNARSPIERNLMLADDPERAPYGNICQQRTNECAGDVRYYDWAKQGFGIRRPVLFTARDGATISGNVWATRAGPPQRPAIVITTGSVQAPETLYWGLAATLAKHGYVVLTYDVQGQGLSDTLGEGVDSTEGVPSQSGEPFYDGTEDGLDFLLSNRAHPYEPRPSCSTGTVHSAKQDRRVRQGFDSRFNPLWKLVDPSRVGIAGHSLGAGAVSYVGQEDPRVDAIVAWDNLAGSDGSGGGFGSVPSCTSDPASRQPVPMTKPALGMSNDYGLVPEPYTSDPDPASHNTAFDAYRNDGVDSMQVNTRGGTHYEYSLLPGNTFPYPFGTGTLRGMDMAAWYTTAWFDRYVKHDPTADARLLTDRWRHDSREGDIDASGDSNLYSFYLQSQYDLHLAGGGEVSCSDMRDGCPTMAPDGGPPGYSYFADTMTRDGAGQAPEACAMPEYGTAADETSVELPGTDAGDSIHGGAGDDQLAGGRSADCLFGDAGKDELLGQAGADKLVATDGAGGDRVSCGPGTDTALVDPGDHVAAGCEHVVG